MAVSGSGTISDPYIPVTFADFKTCVGRTGAYVCLTQDIDVSKDSVYKTGTTASLDILCRYVYGTAMTYSSSTSYAVGNKCTYNDGEHGLCTYECIQACTGVDVSNSEYWTRGGNPTKKITGLIITANQCFSCNQYNNEITMANLFFESCVWDKTYNSDMFIGNTSYSGTSITINDCAFSMFYNQHNYSPTICTQGMFKFYRCSMYLKYPGNFISSDVSYGNALIRSRFNNCTIDIEDVGLCCDSVGGQNLTYGNGGNPIVNSSIRVKAYITTSGSSKYIGFATTGSFSAITVLGVSGDTECTLVPLSYYMLGTNIIDKDVVGQATLGTTTNLIQGTTAQCKDKDWLTSQGFFTT